MVIVIVTVIATTMFMVLLSWHCHCESSPGSSDECSMQRQVAAECRPLDQADQPEPTDPPIGSCSDYTHHRHLLLLSPKADLFYHPTEGRRLSWPSWLVSYQDGSPALRPIQVLTRHMAKQLCWIDTMCYRYATLPTSTTHWMYMKYLNTCKLFAHHFYCF